ncbi:competence/damage-inducible protein A [Gorillibacterium sp. sgz5001074]|uniref:competence/damage-inducible protein A n=1 Tax=Gorillibacterium sp. sgz5001074 TaxID=3446695 RepID=UPI003F673D68
MRAEIIAVGTELLLGQIVNTNAQFLAQECAALGVDVYFQTVVGDNEARLLQALELASKRAELILCTGGLGPTQDDLTKDVLGRFLGKALSIHEPSMERIRNVFSSRGIHMVESNARQALMLEDGDPLPNDTGLAVGVGISSGGRHYILLPGPPREMKPMFQTYAKTWLQGVMTDAVPLHSKMLKFCGIGESTLEHELLDLIESQEDPTIAPYAKEGEVTIRLATKAHSTEEAEAKMQPTEEIIRSRLGQYLYAEEDVGLERVVVRLLQERGRTAAVAESCTGGLLSDLITSVPGCSSVFKGGIISYSNELKHRLLKVPMEVLEGEGAPGAVSAETARLMAENLLQELNVDYALSVTGVAGPGPSEGKPAGTVFIGLAEKGRPAEVMESKLSGNRDMVKLRAAKLAFYQLWKRLK